MCCYRLRMKFGPNGKDFAKAVWQSGHVGIWFGSWDISDLYDSYEVCRPKPNAQANPLGVEKQINAILRGRGLPENMKAEYLNTILMFDDKLLKDTWVFTYFDECLHFGQVADVTCYDYPKFNWEQEHFKAKKLKNCKTFELSKLPDAFRNLASAGRQTLCQLKSYKKLVSLLIASKDEKEVLATVRKLSLYEWIDILGPEGWESICTAYLILEHGFIPTGLLIGRTLKDFDIVGHDLQGSPIYGQCKKTSIAHQFSEDEKEAFDGLPAVAKKFFFPFAGPEEWPLSGVECISLRTILDWMATTERGRKYSIVLRTGE